MKSNAEAPGPVAVPQDEVVQIEDIKQAVAETERGEFASEGDVNAFFAKYGG